MSAKLFVVGSYHRRVISSSLLLFVSLLNFKISTCIFVESDLKYFECQEGWTGQLPEYYANWLSECSRDKNVPKTCQQHCVAEKYGLILDGKIWLYKLVQVLAYIFPGPLGRDSVDKLTDVILECADMHEKSVGPLSWYRCYREKKLWDCVHRAAAKICANNAKRNEEYKKSQQMHHKDKLVNEKHEVKSNAESTDTEINTKTQKRMILADDYD